jgi:hypothetical protein
MATTQQPAQVTHGSAAREWTPHIWEGMDFLAWARLLVRNRFRVHPAYWHVAVIVSFVSLFHTLLRFLQDAIYGRRLRHTVLRHPPLFIVGHWRTGTTLLHELLILDSRHAYPNTYQCLEPNHFLLTERLFKRAFWFLMPSQRPMDNMPAGFDRPQEDEFALAMMGQPSPYLTIAFPNHPPQDLQALDLEQLRPLRRTAWKRGFLNFLKKIALKDPRRLVLKSPTHSCRIPTLLELFPDAQFVHIVRDPHVVYPSTVNLWKTLYTTHGLQKPHFRGLEDYVFETFNHLYAQLEEGRKRVPPGNYHEVRYEDLVAEPVQEMRKLYDKLGLGGFEEVRPALEKFLAGFKEYKTNRYPTTDELRAKIDERWGHVIRRYGYGAKVETPAAASAVNGASPSRVRGLPPSLPAAPKWPQPSVEPVGSMAAPHA